MLANYRYYASAYHRDDPRAHQLDDSRVVQRSLPGAFSDAARFVEWARGIAPLDLAPNLTRGVRERLCSNNRRRIPVFGVACHPTTSLLLRGKRATVSQARVLRCEVQAQRLVTRSDRADGCRTELH